jgi:hypothetical protein
MHVDGEAYQESEGSEKSAESDNKRRKSVSAHSESATSFEDDRHDQ